MFIDRDRTLTSVRYSCLDGCPVIISGGATGIGEGIVRAFAEQGSKVGFVDNNMDAGKALMEELRSKGATVTFKNCDITDTPFYKIILNEISTELGGCAVLVNNAANDTRHDWSEVTPEEFSDRIAVNMQHTFFACQTVAPGMIEASGGSIINFGSISWMRAPARMSVYAAAKAGIHGMTRALAREFGKHNIRVNTVVPGWVMTQRQIDLWVDEEGLRDLKNGQCLSGFVLPLDIAAMVLFLASDQSRMCSAQNFIVDGGWV